MLGKIFEFLNYLLLKMTWLQDGVNYLLERVFGMDPNNMLFGSLSFFLYDIIKIFLLLSILIFISSYIQTFIDVETTKKTLQKFKGFWGNLFGALMGTVTPFCSCSSIPIFIGFTKAGLPIGVTFSFLISSPLVDLASLVLIASIFGWEFALFYVVIGIVLAVVGGSIIQALHLEDQVADFIKTQNNQDVELETKALTIKDRSKAALREVGDIINRVWKYIILGVLIGALIHGYIPENFLNKVLGDSHWYSVLVATVVGIPMYSDIFGALPIAEALVLKGIGAGTVLAFMMSVTTLSIPSLVMLSKVVKRKLLGVFIGIVTVGIIIVGYIFNLIL